MPWDGSEATETGEGRRLLGGRGGKEKGGAPVVGDWVSSRGRKGKKRRRNQPVVVVAARAPK